MLQILKTILKFFTVEPARKILAALFAFGLWLFVAVEGMYNYERDIAVIYTNLPDTYIITKSEAKLKVIFSGKGKNLIGIWLSPPKAMCNLSDVVPGKNVISTEDFVVPVKDIVANYKVKYVNVEIDEKQTKWIKPLIPIKGSLKNGFAISAIEVLDTLSATGPKNILRQLDGVITESLDVNNQFATFEKRLKIESSMEHVKFSKNNVTVRVMVDSLIQWSFTAVAVNVLKNQGQIVRVLNPHIDTIVISGAKSRINNIKKEEITVRIKTTDLVSGEYYLSPEIILPDFLTAVYYQPQRLKVLVY
ncbi:MAG: hypothetical protein ACUVQ3_01835 [bacterium]